MKNLIIGLVLAALLIPAGLYFAGVIQLPERTADAEQQALDDAPTYLPLDPPFVVNFTHRGTLRYLQVSLEVTYKDINLLTKVSDRMPQIRNDLILLFSGQDYEQLSTQAGKERLRAEIMAAINRIIGVRTPPRVAALPVDAVGSAPVDAMSAPLPDGQDIGAVYITNFVMQ